MTESENTKMDIAIGICAYNESQNIERCIRSIYEQDTRNVNVKEVLVVSSGSTDGTDDIVRGLMDEYLTNAGNAILRRRTTMRIYKTKNYDEMSRKAANIISALG